MIAKAEPRTRIKGFTIVELLIVIVVIGILAAIIIVSFNGVQAKAKTVQVKSTAATLLQKIEYYRTLSGNTMNGYPISDQAHQHWYIEEGSDLASDDPSTKLPDNLRIVRGRDNWTDATGSTYESISVVSQQNPAIYDIIVCTNADHTVQTGVKIAYPDYSAKTVQWLRSGDCPAVPSTAPSPEWE